MGATADEVEVRAAERLANKINMLFDTVYDRSVRDRPYSTNEVAQWLQEHADEGPTISANYLRALRGAWRTNPTANSLRAIARFFQVDPGYLLTDDRKTEELHQELSALRLLADASARGIATRAASLDASTQAWVLQMLETLPTHRERESREQEDTSSR
ncbi:hypothetical protein [Pseudonocardia sp. ICBG1293]|uniref:hypothetical protein n=1 Tax=Pseudonocardia sp. ICBG1293 TaxID=2844382 RepID=UPI001CCF83BC|nr:hypothetical protein [Pseudonocardia sp. ICBG1293]